MFVTGWLIYPQRRVEHAVTFGVLFAALILINVVSRWLFGPTLSISADLFIGQTSWRGVREAMPLRLVPLTALLSQPFWDRFVGGPFLLQGAGGPRLVVYPGLYKRSALVAFLETARLAQEAAT
jgi:hypothetical protein